MKIKNENITIKPFSVEYTKERTEWEEKQEQKYKKALNYCTTGIFLLLVAFGVGVFISAICTFSSHERIGTAYAIFLLIVLFCYIGLFVNMIFDDIPDSICIISYVIVKNHMKWYYTPHGVVSCRTIFFVQELWKQIAKCIEDGTAKVNLSEDTKADEKRLILNIKFKDKDKNTVKETFVVKRDPDKKEKGEPLSTDSLVISFYDVKSKDWRPFTNFNKTYVYVS